MNFFDGARIALSFNEIVDAKGACQENEDAACEIGERAVDGKSDADAERGDQGSDAAGIDADVPDEANHDDDFCRDTKNVDEGASDRLICCVTLGGSLDFS